MGRGIEGAGSKLPVGRMSTALQDLVPYLTVTVADATGNAGTATIQAVDAAGNALAARFLARVWIAEAAYSEADPQTDFSVSTGEEMTEVEANADYEVISDATGLIVMAIAVAAPKTVHAMAEINGRVYTGSVAITT